MELLIKWKSAVQKRRHFIKNVSNDVKWHNERGFKIHCSFTYRRFWLYCIWVDGLMYTYEINWNWNCKGMHHGGFSWPWPAMIDRNWLSPISITSIYRNYNMINIYTMKPLPINMCDNIVEYHQIWPLYEVAKFRRCQWFHLRWIWHKRSVRGCGS